MVKQSKTTIKELSAQYRSVLKRAFLAGVVMAATSGVANAAITEADIAAINANINMQESDGTYTTSKGEFNVGTTQYDTAAGYGQYTYDHDNNPETAQIALTTNNSSETLDNTLFTYTDNNGAITNLDVRAAGFAAGDFTATAGTVDVAHGTSDLSGLTTTTSVGFGNYQYMANFDNSGEALTALTETAPELSAFHNDILLASGESLTVHGNDESNKPNIDDYGFTVTLHDGSEGQFGLAYNDTTHLYTYVYEGAVELDATDIAAADAKVVTQKTNLSNDQQAFNDAIVTNTSNYNTTLGHYNAVHGTYESDSSNQANLNTNYENYQTSYAIAVANQSAAQINLEAAQTAYADDLSIYTGVKTAYDNYENSLGKSIDAKVATLENGAVATNAAAIETEKNRATAAESALDTRVSANETAVATNTAAIETEKNRATAAESALDTRVSANETAIATNTAAIETEKNRATAAESALDTRVSANEAAIAAETTAREEADTAIRGEFAEADATLQSNIDAETTRATAAEASLQTAINDINTASVAAVDALDARVSANTNAIAGLNSKVDSLEKNVSGGVAAATALSSVAVSAVSKGEVSVGGGYGYYNNQSAVAFGAAMGLTDNWSVNAGTGIATGDKTQVSFRAGTNYKFKLF